MRFGDGSCRKGLPGSGFPPPVKPLRGMMGRGEGQAGLLLAGVRWGMHPPNPLNVGLLVGRLPGGSGRRGCGEGLAGAWVPLLRLRRWRKATCLNANGCRAGFGATPPLAQGNPRLRGGRLVSTPTAVARGSAWG